MGYLAAKDLGAVTVKTSSNVFIGDNASPDGIFNPGNEFNVLALNPFVFSYDTGKNIDTRPNIAGNITRINAGSKLPIPFTLNARYSRRTDRNVSEITAEDLVTINHLVQWARANTIVMLFYMPNENDSTLLNHGQEVDFFTSQIRTIYDIVWDRNTSSSTSGFQATTYGTYHFSVTMGGSIGEYLPAAIPVVFENVTVREDAAKTTVEVTATGYCLENEQRTSI